MDIFSLPDVFLRKLMRTVTIRDRTRLRLVCRQFEQLVASTHAGYFERAIFQVSSGRVNGMTSIIFLIDDERHQSTIANEDLERFVANWNRLFSGIAFGSFSLSQSHNTFKFDQINGLTSKLKNSKIDSTVRGNEQLESTLRLMARFPGCLHAMHLLFFPETDILLSLPRLESLHVTAPGEISAEILIKFIAAHVNVHLIMKVILTVEAWQEMMRILSDDTRKRCIRLEVNCATFVNILRRCGITQISREGDAYGKYEIVSVEPESKLMHIRYRNCNITVAYLDWTSIDWHCEISITNSE